MARCGFSWSSTAPPRWKTAPAHRPLPPGDRREDGVADRNEPRQEPVCRLTPDQATRLLVSRRKYECENIPVAGCRGLGRGHDGRPCATAVPALRISGPAVRLLPGVDGH